MAADGSGTGGFSIPHFELLEDRIVLDGVPDVEITAPASIDLGEQDVPVTLTFDNVGTDAGYVPYIDLWLIWIAPRL